MHIQKVEEILKTNSGVSLNAEKKLEIKKNIIAFTKTHEPFEEFGFAVLINKIRAIAAEFLPGAYFKTLLREKLITIAEFQQLRIERGFKYIFKNLLLSRKFVASVVAVFFIFAVFFNFTLNVERVEASLLTVIQETSGNVQILRDSRVLTGKVGLTLKADDIIKTSSKSSAIIQFLDQSVSRLDENTEVKISKLFINPFNKTETAVELVLSKGRLWARVVNLIDNLSRFQVKAENAVAVARKKAAFDVKILPAGKARVTTLQNKIDLVVATPNKKTVSTALSKGFSAEFKNTGATGPKIQQDQDLSSKDKWVADNLKQDKVYIESVKQEAQAQIRDGATMLPGNPLYAVKELSENTRIALTLNGIDKQKKIVAVVQEKLAEAEILLERGEIERAKPLLDAFQKQIKGISEWLKSYEVDHPAEALELKMMLSDLLNGYQKQLALMLPHEPLYMLKETVARTQVLVSSDSAEKTQMKLSQASEKLFEAHDLADQGDTAAATIQVEAYSKSIGEVASEVKNLPSDEKDKAVSALLENRVEDLKILESLSIGSATPMLLAPPAINRPGQTAVESAAAAAADSKELKRTISDVKTETLTRIGEAVIDSQKPNPSVRPAAPDFGTTTPAAPPTLRTAD